MEPRAMAELGAREVRADSMADGFAASNTLDGDPKTIWHTPWGEGATPFPHELVIAFEKPVQMTGCRVLPRQDVGNGWIRG